eukprot:scaffold66115_cov19-Tisochrysis_lutea.AAC.1
MRTFLLSSRGGKHRNIQHSDPQNGRAKREPAIVYLYLPPTLENPRLRRVHRAHGGFVFTLPSSPPVALSTYNSE